MKKILWKSGLIAVLYFVAVLINACCNCKDYKNPIYFNIENIDASNIKYTFEADTLFRITPFSDDSVQAKSYGISVSLDAKRIASLGTSDLFNFHNAYACKCNIDNKFLTDTIKEVHIKTLNDFDPDHLAGSNVDKYFRFLQVEHGTTKDSIAYNPIYTTPFFLTPFQVFYFYLNITPTIGSKIQFEISLTTTKGRTYTSTTSPITLF